jgi:hypothetical protein
MKSVHVSALGSVSTPNSGLGSGAGHDAPTETQLVEGLSDHHSVVPSCGNATPDTSRDVPASKQERGEGDEAGDDGDEHRQCLRAVHEGPTEGAWPA